MKSLIPKGILEKVDPTPMDRVRAVHSIAKAYERALEVFTTPERAVIWLTTPCYVLDFGRPIDMLSSETGVRKVFCILGRIQHGVYS